MPLGSAALVASHRLLFVFAPKRKHDDDTWRRRRRTLLVVPGLPCRLLETRVRKGKSWRGTSNVLEGAAQTRRGTRPRRRPEQHSDRVDGDDAAGQGFRATAPCRSLRESRWERIVFQALPSIPPREISK